MADNLRALAKQSWDSVFAEAYPKLANMIRSINEEMDRTLQDSRRELRSAAIGIEGFSEKLIATKSSISSLVKSQESINSYLLRLHDNWQDSGSSDNNSSITKNILSKAAPVAGAVATRSPMGLGLKALLALTGVAGAAGIANALKTDENETRQDASQTNPGSQSGNPLSSLMASDSIRFVADKIIFKSSSQEGQGGQESAPSSSMGGGGSQSSGGTPDADRTRSAGGGGQSRGSGGGGGGGFSPMEMGGGGGMFGGGGMGSQSSFLVPGRNSRAAQSRAMQSNYSFDATQVGGRSNVTPSVSQGEYYNKMYSAVYAAAKERGIPNPEVVASLGAAQTSLETGYGKHMVGNNAFGIKGSGSAGSVNANTQEFVNGRMVGMKQNFRAYDDVTQSAGDFVDMMLKNPKRYGGVLNATTVEEAIAAQARSGYATDPAYGSKLKSINSKFTGASPSTNVADKPVPNKPTTGSNINQASIESKVDKEKQQQTASLEINNLVSQSPSSQSGEKTPEQPSGKDVGVNDRLGRLITAS